LNARKSGRMISVKATMGYASRAAFVVVLACLAGSADLLSSPGNLGSADADNVFAHSVPQAAYFYLLLRSCGHGGGASAAGMGIPPGCCGHYLSLFTGSGATAANCLSYGCGCPPGPPDMNRRVARISATGVPTGSACSSSPQPAPPPGCRTPASFLSQALAHRSGRPRT
jgi:hypothetical protein